MRRETILAAVALAAAAGCGGSDAPAPQAQPAAQQGSEAQREARERRRVEAEIRAEERQRSKAAAAKPEPSSGGGFTGAQAKRYQEDKEICELFPASQVAKEYGLPPGSDPVTIAEAYADGYRPEFQQAAFEGCLDGLGS